MTLYHYYTILASGYACYMLGMMHGKGSTHWKNLVMAIVTGAVWPVAVCCGIYATHFKEPNA